jgi:hypothetical protein
MYLPCILILFLFLTVDAPFPLKMDLIFIYSAFIKGDHTYFEIDPLIEGTQLYPHVNYTTVSKYWIKVCLVAKDWSFFLFGKKD